MRIKPLFKSEWFWLIAIVALGGLLRFWKLEEWQHLTFDQARDYLIIKRIIVDHKFTLVGPTLSIAPGFFLPPHYYYSLIPFLYLFDFHILGPDVYTALLGTATIAVFYLIAKDLFGRWGAFATSLAVAINPYLIHASRHAWNPNTAPFFFLLFVLAFERYLFLKKRFYLPVASLALSWAIGLHLTLLIFLPLFIYLLFLDLRKKGFNGLNFFSGLGFSLVFLPLAAFDLRHGFLILRAGLSYLGSQGDHSGGGEIVNRLKFLLNDFTKMPVVLLAGQFLKENLTVRPSNIAVFGQVSVFSAQGGELLAIILAIFLVIVSGFVLARNIKSRKARLVGAFLLLGCLIRLLFPPNSFFFYYYLSVFPLVYLLMAFLVDKLRNLGFKLIASFIIVALPAFSLSRGLKTENKPESYFLPACEIVAKDYSPKDRAAIAVNVADTTRWEHTGHEYRYFLESMYGFPSTGWAAGDYQEANVLYLIDEGDLKEPLELNGMEMEAFRPKEIQQTWTAQTGQKIYKMIR